MNLLVKAKRAGTEIVTVTPQSARWRYVGFAAYRLQPSQQHVLTTLPGDEACIVVLSGRITVRAGEQTWSDIGERMSVFEESSPYAVYVPRAERVTIIAHTHADIGVASAPGGGHIPPQTQPADHLLVVEVITPSGHSSSYPPHKHDTDNLPVESSLEETYYHRLDPPQGFAFQRVYTDDRNLDQSLAVEDHDVVMVPRGYHPVVVPYGYTSYYLNVMAGPKREWHFKNDPAHEWLLKR